jgi:23S rRNA (uridine2552-2'-O)-methyltransferase
MAYQQKDYYFHKAKKEKFVARSIFKLQEIHERFKIFRPGHQVIDLGAAPGSWSQYAATQVGKSGRVLGVDLQPIALTLPNAYFFVGDLRKLPMASLIEKTGITPPFDVVLSDMAPKTTGIRITDQTRSLELCQIAFEVCHSYLKPKGHFICKLFHSDEFEPFRAQLKEAFEKVEVLRPKSTRKESKEIFLIGLNYKKNLKSPPPPATEK